MVQNPSDATQNKSVFKDLFLGVLWQHWLREISLKKHLKKLLL